MSCLTLFVPSELATYKLFTSLAGPMGSKLCHPATVGAASLLALLQYLPSLLDKTDISNQPRKYLLAFCFFYPYVPPTEICSDNRKQLS